MTQGEKQLDHSTLTAARLLWDFHRLGHCVVPADGILVFGSNDLRVATRAAELFHQGMGKWILFSGARGRMTQDWPGTEAETMAQVAIDAGVPKSAILIENRATNTGENIRFSRELLAERGITLHEAMFVQKPYMERRTLAALEVQWSDISLQVTSPPLTIEQYVAGHHSWDEVIAAMVGDLQRIIDYPSRGFASVQDVPASVLAAWNDLISLGYTSQMA
ncbi:MAG TPA: hypothetical protein DDW21_05230 [Verrucomicrobiales bacterium]|nr:hypothetical protein [Verrucomicrobiales bacterium]